MKHIILTILTLSLLTGCGGKQQVTKFSNGVFEITYTGGEYEHFGDIPHKIQLLAAYEAQANRCEYFKEYIDSKNSTRHTAKMGLFSVKSTMSKLYKCASKSEPMAVSTMETIEIQESRFGSLRDLKEK